MRKNGNRFNGYPHKQQQGGDTSMKIHGMVLIMLATVPAWAAEPKAYVGNNGDQQTKQGTISVLNWREGEVINTITVQGRPLSVVANSDGELVYALSESDSADTSYLSVIRTREDKIVETKPLEGIGSSGPSALAASPDGKYIVVTKHDGSVLILSARDLSILSTVVIEGSTADAVAVAFAPDGKFAYILGQDLTNGSSVTVLCMTTKKVLTTIHCGNYAASMAITPDGLWLYVGDYNGPVCVISTKTNSVTTLIPIYYAPSIVANPIGTSVWVSSESQDYATSQINIVDVATKNVVQTAQESPAWVPLTLGFTPDGQYAYETDGSNNLQVVSTATDLVTKTITVGESPIAVAFLPFRSFSVPVLPSDPFSPREDKDR